MEEAAGVPLCGLTALQSLAKCDTTNGNSILIHAGAGGLGTLLIQMAKSRRLKITTTCSTENVEFLYALGADTVIDYTKSPFEKQLGYRKQFHAIIDCIGGEYEERSKLLLLDSGVYVAVLSSGWVRIFEVNLEEIEILSYII